MVKLQPKNDDCTRSIDSYRFEFSTHGNTGFHTYFAPFDSFSGHGPNASTTPFSPKHLRRIALAALDKRYKSLEVGFTDVAFYNYP